MHFITHMSFASTGLRSEIIDAISDLGFTEPTPIQAKAIPYLLDSNKDLIASAQTGTGKTGAFGLPIVHKADPANRSTQSIVLCPTRELCIQITRDLQDYAKNVKGLNIVPVYGGANIETQIRALKKGAQIVVATPGRARDLIERRKLDISQVQAVVLDEADEMLTMGFQEELNAILEQTPTEKQTLLFSATMSKEIRKITSKYMNNPEEIAAERVNTGSENVDHLFYSVNARDRYPLLKRIADANPSVYGIVFCRTRRDTKDIAAKLMEDGYNADALHGDLSQAQRDEVMNRFRSKHLQLLVATDVAARGLDVNNLTHVINFNLPDDPEAYIHRSGRTGRAGNKGISIAILTRRDMPMIKSIERIASIKFSKADPPTGKEICTNQLYALIDRIKQTEVDETEIEPFLPQIYEKLGELDREELIKRFVSIEFNRFLEYYRDARDLQTASQQREKRTKQERTSSNSNFARMFINAGSKNEMNPARLIGVINEALDSNSAEIGKIEIQRKFSFFEIEEKHAEKLAQSIKGAEFEGVTLNVERSQGRPDYAENRRDKKPYAQQNKRKKHYPKGESAFIPRKKRNKRK